MPSKDIYVWICAFCNNQYRIMEEMNGNGADNLEEIFENRLKACGRMVALLDKWEQPADSKTTYTTRIWCIFEQYTALKLNIPVEFILPKDESTDFTNALQERGLKSIKEKISAIECRNAIASNPKDQEKVRHIIESEYGYDHVNDTVKARFAKWCSEAFSRELTRRESLEAIQPNAILDP